MNAKTIVAGICDLGRKRQERNSQSLNGILEIKDTFPQVSKI